MRVNEPKAWSTYLRLLLYRFCPLSLSCIENNILLFKKVHFRCNTIVTITTTYVPVKLISIWCPGITSICWMHFLLKALLYLTNSTLGLSSFKTTRYINKWPCCVPTNKCSPISILNFGKHRIINASFFLPYAVKHSIWTVSFKSWETWYASCILLCTNGTYNSYYPIT